MLKQEIQKTILDTCNLTSNKTMLKNDLPKKSISIVELKSDINNATYRSQAAGCITAKCNNNAKCNTNHKCNTN